MSTGFFITGTGTGIGKTYASCVLLHALRARGLRAVGMKPVASGCVLTSDGWRNDDALALQAASDPLPSYELVNPYALPEATAPQIATVHAGIDIQIDPIIAAYQTLQKHADLVVVEGVGGFLAPITELLDQPQLPIALNLPVIIVVGLALGCINHARLTVEAVRARGLPIVGWICSRFDPALTFADDYFVATQGALSDLICLADLKYDQVRSASGQASAINIATIENYLAT